MQCYRRQFNLNTIYSRAKTGVDKEREALEQQARVKGKKGFKKDDYNPLMGMGGGSGYRPAPRRGASGGG